MTTPADLDRRLSRRLEQGKGIQLSPADLDLLVTSGAREIIAREAASEAAGLPEPPIYVCADSPFIYFMQAAPHAPVKIGISRSPASRLQGHQVSTPEDFRFIALFRAQPWFENYLHNAFSIEWIRREWFHPTGRLLRYAAERGIQQ